MLRFLGSVKVLNEGAIAHRGATSSLAVPKDGKDADALRRLSGEQQRAPSPRPPSPRLPSPRRPDAAPAAGAAQQARTHEHVEGAIDSALSSWSEGGADESGKIAARLNRAILALYGKYLSDDGKAVDYVGLGGSAEFTEYTTMTVQLLRLRPTELSGKEKIAFFLNLYNALVIHGYVALGVPNGSHARLSFYTSTAYRVGDFVLTLDDIEHGVLRGNCASPSQWMGKSHWSSSDPRCALSVPPHEIDPRVHFALVCGARSCPPIRVFTGANLDAALQMAAKAFCGDSVSVDVAQRRVTLSMILKWYGGDFGKTRRERAEALLPFLGDEAAKALRDLLAAVDQPTFVYTEYDWTTNDKKR